MGTDIHGHIEYRLGDRWRSFCTLHLCRDYRLFNLIAGVRHREEDQPSFEPKGFPKDACFYTAGDYTLIVVEGNSAEAGCCTREQAARWLKNGSSTTYEDDGVCPKITHPDWHTPTWLTTEEVAEVLERHDSQELRAIYATMRALGEARVVLWFDN